jgi:hypothetical protein
MAQRNANAEDVAKGNAAVRPADDPDRRPIAPLASRAPSVKTEG